MIKKETSFIDLKQVKIDDPPHTYSPDKADPSDSIYNELYGKIAKITINFIVVTHKFAQICT